MSPTLRESLESKLGRSILTTRPLTGGDICQAFLVTFRDHKRVFVKCKPGGPREMFEAEARGLDWLRRAAALRLPEVVAACPEFLALEYLESAPRTPDFDEALGRGLAALHRCPVSSGVGLDHDNFIGPLPQSNSALGSWVEFLVERRLRPQVERALRSGGAPRAWRDRFERLYRALPDFVPQEPPSRLHGDLWGGNLLVGPNGEPCLIDPAAYAGHREVDLAMMKLFGGFGRRVFEAYDFDFPLLSGHQQRVNLYQLYPLLVHVNLFGGGYAGSVERALDSLPAG